MAAATTTDRPELLSGYAGYRRGAVTSRDESATQKEPQNGCG